MSFSTEFEYAKRRIQEIRSHDSNRRPTLLLVCGEKSGSGRTFLANLARIVPTVTAAQIYKQGVLKDPVLQSDLKTLKAKQIVKHCERLGINPKKPGKKSNRAKKELVDIIKRSITCLNMLDVDDVLKSSHPDVVRDEVIKPQTGSDVISRGSDCKRVETTTTPAPDTV